MTYRKKNTKEFSIIDGLDSEVLSGGVSEETILLPISVYRYLELIKFNVLETGDYDIVLGSITRVLTSSRDESPLTGVSVRKSTINTNPVGRGLYRGTLVVPPTSHNLESLDISDQELAEYMIVNDKPQILDEYPPAEGTLPEYRIFDHKINTIEGTKPTFKPIY
ncbi:Retrotransposon polyprotein [Penicillium chrysogenum]|uniref:Retrotransposon polyprotein n=1 Tax=Penicillium chrysogenum TaxID=5076 RepID=UPI0024DF2F4D|nr:Retrotransposon polyprotein [Penicillium chrysogenum]KAJ5243925.1 Retrotransposon polyprotein [Penicillium chrysogenum]